MHRTLSRPAAVVTAIALIVLPLAGLVFKIASPGWLLVFGVLGPLEVLAIGYALQLAIAISGFLARRAVFVATGSRRAVVASWIGAIGVLVAGFFVVDFGDVEPGYSFFTQLVTPTSYDDAYVAGGFTLVDLSGTIALVALIPWFGGWVWLVVEWGIAIRGARRLARESHAGFQLT